MTQRLSRFFRLFNERSLLFNLKGRATRREFVFFTLLAFICLVISLAPGTDSFSLITALLSAFIFIAVSIRRFHDSGQSAWALLSLGIPYIGLGWFLFSAFQSPHDHTNEYGPNPRYEPDFD